MSNTVNGIVFSDDAVVVEDCAFKQDMIVLDGPGAMVKRNDECCAISVISDLDVRFQREEDQNKDSGADEDLYIVKGKVGILDVDGAKKIRDALNKFIDMAEGRTT